MAYLLSALALAAASSPPELEWNDLTFTVKGRPILDGVSGRARGGRMLAIMGPSGSGKTSVLNALAGQVRASKRAALHGTLRVNGERVGKASEAAGVRLAYLQQEDIFYAQMTVRET